MAPDDARLSLERHATSKIRTAADLAAIATLGFRGEALPVHRLGLAPHLRSRHAAPSGGGFSPSAAASSAVRGGAGPPGTRIDVRDLFFNPPARRKFLKSDAAEAGQVSRVVTQLALGSSNGGFHVAERGPAGPSVPAGIVVTPRAPVSTVWPHEGDLVEVRRETAGIVLEGYIAALAELVHSAARRTSSSTAGCPRPDDRSRDRGRLQRRLDQGAQSRSAPVHRDAARRGRRERAPDQSRGALSRAVPRAPGRSSVPRRCAWPGAGASTHAHPQARPTPVVRSAKHALSPACWPAEPIEVAGEGRFPGGGSAGATIDQRTWHPLHLTHLSHRTRHPPYSARHGGFAPLIALGQFRDTFIIAVDADGVAIIDQHVAHERVLYERTLERLTTGRLETQRLLVPMMVEMTSAARQALMTRGRSRSAGLRGRGVRRRRVTSIGAVPGLIGTSDPAAETLRALAYDLEGLDRGSPAEAALKHMSATIACHAAVKANYPLTYEKMVHILSELAATAYSTVCPHGRPVMLRLTRREIREELSTHLNCSAAVLQCCGAAVQC